MTTERDENLFQCLKSIQDIRREFLARLREVEAVIEGMINKAPEPPKEAV